MVDEVVMLMQQLTNALETSGEDCGKVEEVLTYYQAQMARYLAQGQVLYGHLDNEDIELLTQYAQTKVAPFASNLEVAVRRSSTTCSLPVSAFIPTASFSAAMAAAPKANGAVLKIKALKQELQRVQQKRKAAAIGGTGGGKLVKAVKGAAKGATKARKPVAMAVEQERARVSQLRAQVAQLKAEANSMDQRL
mmetsp:Transcript_1814/g.4213  ORF Transcript_1814/g.4213 Transcript_1814/m.4213 type:complete len:193 (-) Transcript_1814:21-599(-)